ncbi:sodium-dependent dicarboxylate transporter SdcS [Oxobacter pfennigii]|uniref:Sodium-dependent dicarboxylate transporter SdcS n=1 Tax=Oxobacter pfennigii TaxID=36849 RepID=A0A0P8WAA4_9CLOT|nr:SLC13 family permease [Oxobacter pfennigii]KPU44894.1 sodium-dependent dicarboxylate transporter SdcS [Oxobacter pfennigii]
MSEIIKKSNLNTSLSLEVIKKNYLHIFISLAIFLVIRIFLPAGNGLTDKGVTVLALFMGTIWLWIFVGVDWSSLLAPAVMIMAGVLSQADMLAVSFGNFCFAYVLAGMLLNAALVDAGVIQHIASWFISRKICKGRPWVFITLFLLSCLLIAMFLDCVPVTLIYLTMVDGLCQELGYEKGSKFGQALVAAVLWLVVIGYGATPISHPIAVLMLGFLNDAHSTVSFVQFMAIGIPFAIFFFALTILALKIFVKPDFSKFAAYDPEERIKGMKPLSIQAKISLAVFIAVVIMWLMPDAMAPILPGISAYFKTVGMVAPPLLGIAVLSIVRVKREDNAAVVEPVLDLKKKIYQISLPTLIFIVGIQSFANTLNSPVTGISKFLGNLFQPVAQNVSPGTLVFIAMLLAIAITQFMSNLVVQALMWSAFLPVIQAVNAAGGKLNMAAFGIILSIVVNVAFIFPSAYVCAPLCYTSGYLEVKDGVKLGLPMVIVAYLVLLIVFFPIASAIL